MSQVHYRVLGPLTPSATTSRARLGLEVGPGGAARPVVLVFAPPEVVGDAQALAQLRAETQRAVILEHPHINRVHGLATLEEGVARVTEYAEGESLRTVLSRAGRLPVHLAVRLVADVAMGLHYGHLAGNDDGSPLVHGDLRPETVMVAFSGASKVTGYGALGVAPREAGGRRVVNRRVYCAPEQIVGGRSAVLVATDVFLLGLLLHECLGGQRPFADAEDFDQAVLTSPLAQLPGDVPAALALVVEKCTAKRAPARFASALAVREALEQAVGGSLAPQEELSQWLGQLFPTDDAARAFRQRVLDSGIAQLAREQWALKQPVAAELPAQVSAAPVAAPPPVESVPAAPPAVAAPAVAAPSPAAPASPAVPPGEQPALAVRVHPRFRVSAWVKGGVAMLALLLGAAVVGPRFGLPGLTTPASEPQAVAVPDAGQPVDGAALASAAAADGGAGALAEAAGDGGAALAQAEVDAGVREDVGDLVLDVEPSVQVAAGETQLGRTPLKASLPAGRHVLTLANPARGISTQRAVVVPAGGVVRQQFVLSRGYVTINAPEGARVSIDGKPVGTGTVREVGLYEGLHRVSVSVDGDTWNQTFHLKANQRVSFDVAPESDSEE